MDSPFCSFCVQRIETILQLFCFRPVVDQFWNEVFSCACCHFKRDIDFCNFNKIFGFQELENCDKTDLINRFLLNARFSIHRCKIEKNKPNMLLWPPAKGSHISTITKVSSALLRTANPGYTHSRLYRLFCIALPRHLDFISFLGCALFLAGDWPQTTIPNRLLKIGHSLEKR